MRRKLFLVLSVFGMVGFIYSCGDNIESTAFQEPNTSKEINFIGSYLSTCEFNELDSISSRNQIDITNSTITYSSTVYDSSDCTKDTLRFKIEEQSLYKITGTHEGSTIIKETTSSIKVTYFKEDDIKELNQESVFGFSDWTGGVEKDITNFYIQEVTNDGNFTEYSTLKLDENMLYRNIYWPEKEKASLDNDENSNVEIFTRIDSNTPTKINLNGVYVSECTIDEKRPGTSYTEKLVVSDSKIIQTYTQYHYDGELSCKEENKETYAEFIQNYTQQGRFGDSFMLYLTFSSIKLTLLTDKLVEESNDESSFGFNDWTINTAKELVSGTKPSLYVVTKIEDGKLKYSTYNEDTKKIEETTLYTKIK